jgi:cullin 3
MHLIPLIKCKVLLKSPSQNSFNADDKISVNLDFKSNLLRNKIPVLVSKNAKEQDNFRVQGKVEDDRRYQIEAAIIKVMKARR